jgi:hypothetical protein
MTPSTKRRLFLAAIFSTFLWTALAGVYDELRQATPIPELAIYEQLQYRAEAAQSHQDSLAAARQIVAICFAHGKHDLARTYLRNLPELEADTSNALVAYSYLRDRQYLIARSAALNNPSAQTAKSLSHMYLADWAQAEKSIARSANPELAHVLTELRQAPRKKPYLAGSLAVIPGLGYAYNGMYQTALSAFLMNAAILATVWELQDRGLPIAAASLALAGSSFYIGNIWGSANAAEKINLQRRARTLDYLIDPYIMELLELP